HPLLSGCPSGAARGPGGDRVRGVAPPAPGARGRAAETEHPDRHPQAGGASSGLGRPLPVEVRPGASPPGAGRVAPVLEARPSGGRPPGRTRPAGTEPEARPLGPVRSIPATTVSAARDAGSLDRRPPAA